MISFLFVGLQLANQIPYGLELLAQFRKSGQHGTETSRFGLLFHLRCQFRQRIAAEVYGGALDRVDLALCGSDVARREVSFEIRQLPWNIFEKSLLNRCIEGWLTGHRRCLRTS